MFKRQELEFTHEDDKKQLLKMFASRQDKLEWLDAFSQHRANSTRSALSLTILFGSMLKDWRVRASCS